MGQQSVFINYTIPFLVIMIFCGKNETEIEIFGALLLPPAYVRTAGGYVFTGVCLFNFWGGYPISVLGRGYPISGLGRGGTPSQVQVGGYPIPGLGRGGYPEYPLDLGWGTPPDLGWSNPPRNWDGVPPSPQTWDGVPPGPGMGYPPGIGTG